MFSPTSEGLWVAEVVREGEGRIGDFLLVDYHGPDQSARDHVGRRWTDIRPEADGMKVFEFCVGVMETGKPGSQEIRRPEKRTDLWLGIHAYATGSRLTLSVFDITVHKQTERNLRKNQDLLRIAGRMGRLGAWSVELPDFRITWSEEVYRIHDVPTNFDPNLNQAVSFYTPEGQISIREALRQCARDGTPYDLELCFTSAKGRQLWVRTIGQAEYEDGHIKRVFGTFQDITEMRHSAVALEENRQFLKLALSGAEMSISDWHIPSGRILFDENWCRILGYREDEVEQTLEFWDSLIPPEDQPAIMEAQTRYFEGRAALFEVEYRMRARDGSMHWVLERTKIVERDSDGNPVRLSGILHDITSRKETEDRLQLALQSEKELTRKAKAAERAKSEFLAAMSHEIRTPMNGILGFADLLSQSEMDPQQRDYVHTIRRSGGALLRILDDILDYSRLEAGHLRIEAVPFSLRQMLTSVSDLMSPAAHHKGLLLETKIPPQLPDRFEGAVDRLQQVLLNLVGNAIKFTARGSVVVGVRRIHEDGPCEFFVRDTGIGITASQITRIFEPFIQADNSLARRFGGTGLGLAISKRFVEKMGGRLEVESTPGAGSNFHFAIPLQQVQAVFPPPLPEPKFVTDAAFATSHPLTILVAEDDAVNRKLMVRILRSLGYSTLVASDGRQALEIYASHHPNCILMDLHMPEMDGIEATRLIRAIGSDGKPPFIAALTADVMPEERQRCIDAGMDDYLTKPLKQGLLAKTLERAHAAL